MKNTKVLLSFAIFLFFVYLFPIFINERSQTTKLKFKENLIEYTVKNSTVCFSFKGLLTILIYFFVS